MRRLLALGLFVSCSNVTTGGAEICDNGKDDDGDEKADCADPDCFAFTKCCVDQCEPGAGLCDPMGVRSCAMNAASGCLELKAPSACSMGVCSGGACAATCSDRCAAGERTCIGAGAIAECQTLATGCRDWVVLQACPFDTVCGAGTCAPTSACAMVCTVGATRCTAAGAQQTCVNRGNGCSDWSFPQGSCGPIDAGFDAGVADSGTPDSGTPDAGSDGGLPPSDGGDPCATVYCDTAPTNACVSAGIARSYATFGVCVSGACTYVPHDVSCAAGCSNGRCNATGWGELDAGRAAAPRFLWGTSDESVWAVGRNATAIHWDGHAWSQPITGVDSNRELLAVAGSADDDVFALVETGIVLHWSGQGWAPIADLGQWAVASGSGMVSLGRNDVLVARTLVYSSTSTLILYRVTNGVSRMVATTGTMSPCGLGCLWDYHLTLVAFSASDVWIAAGRMLHWDGGSTITVFTGAPAPSTLWFWPESRSSMFASGTGAVHHWNGTTFSPLPTVATWTGALVGGRGGPWYAFSNPNSLVFGPDDLQQWNGATWTKQTIPDAGWAFTDLWASPTGRVFGVEADGRVLIGP